MLDYYFWRSSSGESTSIPLLDGGLSVDFTEWEEEVTNRVRASQTTLIDGPLVLWVFLDFEGPSRKLKGENE